jgi:glycosyltransferase involved in cell wall biosynthesis
MVCRRYRASALGGIWYHLSLLGYGLRVIASIIRFRADIVVVSNSVHPPLLIPLAVAGYKIVPGLANVLWLQNKPLPLRKRLMLRFSSLLYRYFSFAIITVSDDVSAQVRSISGGRTGPIVEWLPTHRRPEIEPRDPPAAGPFRILFVGRIERYKGVFDVLAIARRLLQAGQPDMTFELCGRGTALEELTAAATAAGLSPDRFLLRGHCRHEELREAYARCHAVIAPTTSDFAEGFNQVLVEAILAMRPVVTSWVCPAIRYVRDGVVEVPPDDVEAYGDALLRLVNDREYYESKRQSCRALREPYFDPRNGLAAAFESIFEAAQQGRRPNARTVPVEHDLARPPARSP